LGFGFRGGGGGGFFPTMLLAATPLPTVYGGGGAAVPLLKEPGGGGGGFLKEDALECDLDGGGMVRDVSELAVDDVVLDLPRPPPPVSVLLDCTIREVLMIRLVMAISSICCNASGLLVS